MKKSAVVTGFTFLLGLVSTVTVFGCMPLSGRLADCPDCMVLTGPFQQTDYVPMGADCTPCNTSGPHTYTVVLEGDWYRSKFNDANCMCELKKITTMNCTFTVGVASGDKACFNHAFVWVDSLWCYSIWCGTSCYDGLREVQVGDCMAGYVDMVPCLV